MSSPRGVSPLARACGLALLLSLAAACSTGREYFRPRERALAEAPSGETAAEYDLFYGGARRGEIRVWSNGAFGKEQARGERTVVHVGFEIENGGDATVELLVDRTGLESVTTDAGTEIAAADDKAVRGPPKIAPRAMGRVDLEFPMPEGVAPRDLEAFVVRWSIRAGTDESYEERTPFVEDRRYRYSYYSWSFPFYWHWSYGHYGHYGHCW